MLEQLFPFFWWWATIWCRR